MRRKRYSSKGHRSRADEEKAVEAFVNERTYKNENLAGLHAPFCPLDLPYGSTARREPTFNFFTHGESESSRLARGDK